jgi:N-acetyl-gamma-glutamyl-phosphate reductase common form
VTTPALVLGSGYVAGEFLRLLAGHPHFKVAVAVSESLAGSKVAGAFAHLAPAYPELAFMANAEARAHLKDLPGCAVFAAGAHGSSATLIDELLGAGRGMRVVDVSADFRYRDADAYAAVYGHAHGAPARLPEFSCALPEQLAGTPEAHIAHPGCFATAMLLASVPLLAARLVAPVLYISGVTGSTGSGKTPVAGTHHPQRHANLYAYQPLAHRHVPEVRALAKAATGVLPEIAFVPHSGPFARGIHVTVQAELAAHTDAEAVAAAYSRYYASSPFVQVLGEPPQLKDVVASNYARLAVSVSGRRVAVLCVIDNLVKGAAGGAIQWMNRLYGLAESTGLTAPAPGWS